MTSKRRTYMTKAFGPLPFCPGCGHAPLLKALDKALTRLNPDPAQVVVVTDIGCIGLSCRYFVTSALHALHGRSVTYACGIKLARPELKVIVLMGDGGCGIGGTHLLNAARRNIGVTVIVGNNLNYGMTGGQHSVTTPAGAKTSTTPWGNVEAPMDLCATIAAAGGSWVHRATVFDTDLADVIADAIEQPGFSLLDAWELCTAYYVPRNKLTKKGLLALLDALGFQLGRRADSPRPEYSESYRQALRANLQAEKPRQQLTTRYANRVVRQTGIVLAGGAGQRVRSAATVMAQAAMLAGLNASQKDDFPITVRTGYSVSELIVSPDAIDYTGMESPDYCLLISEHGLNRVRNQMAQLSSECTLFASAAIDLPETRASVHRLPTDALAKKVGRSSVATAAVAALVEATGMVPLEALTAAAQMFQEPAIAQASQKAIEAGAELISSG